MLDIAAGGIVVGSTDAGSTGVADTESDTEIGTEIDTEVDIVVGRLVGTLADKLGVAGMPAEDGQRCVWQSKKFFWLFAWQPHQTSSQH